MIPEYCYTNCRTAFLGIVLYKLFPSLSVFFVHIVPADEAVGEYMEGQKLLLWKNWRVLIHCRANIDKQYRA